METIIERIKNIYIELSYVRMEWNLLKEIDSKIQSNNRNFFIE